MRNSGSSKKLNRRSSRAYVEGNVVRKVDRRHEMPELPRTHVRELEFSQEQKLRKQARKAAIEKQRQIKAERKAKLMRGALIGTAVALFLVTCTVFLSGNVKNTELSGQIDELEAQLQEIKAQNDSREYDINSSVDLNEIISSAKSLGMQRSNADQIVLYEPDSSEYVRQVAEVPAK